MDDEPRRLVEDPDAPSDMRRDLKRASELPPPFDVEAEVKRLAEVRRRAGGGEEE